MSSSSGFCALDDSGLCPHEGLNVLQALEEEALQLSGMTREEAFAIDDYKIGAKYEDHVFINLASVFYNKIYDTDDGKLRNLFKQEREENIQNLADYLQQRTGGGCFYSNRQGFIQLPVNHAHLPLTVELAERWLSYMEDALDDVRREINAEHRKVLFNFLRFTAYHLVVFCKYQKKIVALGGLF